MPLLPPKTRKLPNAAALATLDAQLLTDRSTVFNVLLTQAGEAVLTIAAENHSHAVIIRDAINNGAAYFRMPFDPIIKPAQSC